MHLRLNVSNENQIEKDKEYCFVLERTLGVYGQFSERSCQYLIEEK